MATLIQDLRYAVRTYRRNPAMTATAVLVLALGIAATTATYSVVEAVILRSLPFRDAERIVDIKQAPLKLRASRPGGATSSIAAVDGVREARTSFKEVAAIIGSGQPVLTGFGEAERVGAWHVPSNFFSFLGVEPMFGRTFTADEDRPGAQQIAIVSYGFWTTRLASDAQALSRSITLDDTPVQIVGVMRPDFQFPAKALVWRPMGTYPARPAAAQGPQGGYWILARLRPGITVQQATAELDTIWQRIVASNPRFRDWGASMRPLHDYLVGTSRRPLLLVLAAAALVLLVACANVANLLLARAVVRRQEIATRISIGASRARLVRQLLTESLLLAATAGTAGILLASLAIPILTTLGASELPQLGTIEVNRRVLLVSIAVSMATGALFGLAPALLAIGRRTVISAGTTRWRSRTGDLFLVTQVALTMVLIATASLLADTFIRLMKVETGFVSENVLAARVTLPRYRYASPESIIGFADRTLERLRAQPQVTTAAVATGMPLASGVIGSLKVEGRPAAEGAPYAVISAVTDDYFRVLQIPLKRGRLLRFDALEDHSAVLVDEGLVRRYFPNEEPLGKRLTFYGSSTTATIVGVVGDSRDDLTKDAGPHIYQPLAATPYTFLNVLVRTELPARQFLPGLRSTLREIDPELPVDRLATVRSMMSDSVARQRFLAVLLVMFGGVTLAIAAAGIYGLVSYTVRRRLHEIGIRMALGAGRRQVLALVAARGVGLSSLGIALGVLGAFAATRTMESLLFGTGPRSLLVVTAVGLMLGFVAVLASYAPAREAARVNPVTLLRAE
jgi:predicted permease